MSSLRDNIITSSSHLQSSTFFSHAPKAINPSCLPTHSISIKTESRDSNPPHDTSIDFNTDPVQLYSKVLAIWSAQQTNDNVGFMHRLPFASASSKGLFIFLSGLFVVSLIHKQPSSLSPVVYVQGRTAKGMWYHQQTTIGISRIGKKRGRYGRCSLQAGCCGASVHVRCLCLKSFGHNVGDCKGVSSAQ